MFTPVSCCTCSDFICIIPDWITRDRLGAMQMKHTKSICQPLMYIFMFNEMPVCFPIEEAWLLALLVLCWFHIPTLRLKRCLPFIVQLWVGLSMMVHTDSGFTSPPVVLRDLGSHSLYSGIYLLTGRDSKNAAYSALWPVFSNKFVWINERLLVIGHRED